MPTVEIYKKGQGKYTRICTFIGVMLVTVLGAGLLSSQLATIDWTSTPLVRFGIPTIVVLAMAALMFWVVNRPQTADFLIATESEMKKVSWSSRKEIVGSTKVVIITTVIISLLLFGVDVMFTVLFRWMGVTGA